MRTRTKFLKSLKQPEYGKVLKEGRNNKKLGWIVKKGRFKGYKLFSLTLEERTTCPKTCHHWDDCYGNNMPFAHRFKHGAKLEDALCSEIYDLTRRYPTGILVRLHVLGDFYSVPYVNLWGNLLKVHPNLACFGYTARYHDDIGASIVRVASIFPNRFNVRFSANPPFDKPILSYAVLETYEGDAFTCPEQVNKVDTCASCAACWQTTKTVKFKTH